ncbi:MAG: 30S ribosomal protein S8, partial [Alphaproteobacteria bacterium]|nr:30S ribosomal protein S8 [Alphaproteobacteria bacterium]
KYIDGNGAIQEISVISKPGRRVYSGCFKMPKIMNGLGIAIVSTPHGVMTDHKARLMNVGGEVLCRVV